MSARIPRWWSVAVAMFCIGWGGNQFTPLLTVYRARAGYSQLDVDVFLAAYVVGLIPGLLIASALSDHLGRRPVLLSGVVFSVLGSGALALGPVGHFAALVAGRALTGVAVGVAMAVGTVWVSELSRPPFDATARPGAGARRATIALTLGLGAGPAVAGVLAQWGPHPLVTPFVVHLVLVGAAFGLLWGWGRESRAASDGLGFRSRLRVSAVTDRRFVRTILPMAPWIFGSAAVAYAIVPQVVAIRLGRWSLIYATGLTVATLGVGVLVQPIARRLDRHPAGPAAAVSMVLMTVGVGLAALTAATDSPWWGTVTALVLGAAYGIAVITGLLEVQRIAEPHEVAGLTGVFYGLAYVGFLLPMALAALARWFGYPTLLGLVAVAALLCTLVVGTTARWEPGRRRAGRRSSSPAGSPAGAAGR